MYGTEQEIEGLKAAIRLWIEKKNYFEKKLPTAYDENKKFGLLQDIEDIDKEITKRRIKIDELEHWHVSDADINWQSYTFQPKNAFLRGLFRWFPFLDMRKSFFLLLESNMENYNRKLLEQTFRQYVVPSKWELKPDQLRELAKHINPARKDEALKQLKKEIFGLFTHGFFKLENRYVLIEGDTGVGKTAFLQKLFHDYATTYPSCSLAFIYAGEDTFERIRAIPNKAGTVLFLDAMDEDPLARRDVSLFVDQLSGLVIQFRQAFITCRTQLFKNKEEEWHYLRGKKKLYRLKLDQFTKEESLHFLEWQYMKDPVKMAKAKDILNQKPEFFRRPLLLSWFDFLLESKQTDYNYLFEVYETLLAQWGEWAAPVVEPRVHGSRHYPEKLIAYSKELAWYGFKKAQQQAPEGAVVELAKKHGIETIDARSRSFLRRNTDTDTFEFTHRSLADYFLATLLFDGTIREEDFPFEQYLETTRFYEDMCWRRYADVAVIPRDNSYKYVSLGDAESVGGYYKNELFGLLPNRAARAMMINCAVQLAAYTEAPYWFKLVGFLQEQHPGRQHYLFKDHAEFQHGLTQNSPVDCRGRLYLEQFFAEYIYDQVIQAFGQPVQEEEYGLRLVGNPAPYRDLLPKAYPVLDFGHILGKIQRNKAIASHFGSYIHFYAEGLEIETTNFLDSLSWKLKTLNLSRNALKEIPKEVFRFKELRILDLAQNHIQADDTDLRTLAQLPELRDLNLHGNSLKSMCKEINQPSCLRPLREHLFREPEMVQVPGGAFWMGQPNPDIIKYYDGQTLIKSEDEQPVHRVLLNDFEIAKYTVSIGEFRVFMRESGYVTDAERNVLFEGSFIRDPVEQTYESKPGINWQHDVFGREQDNDRHPVIHVSWNDATAYCQWLSRKTGKPYRLPTEAEWEYAAKGPSRWEEHGAEYQEDLNAVAWYVENSGGTTHPVGQKAANDLGIHDMLGNVNEWCWDWYDTHYYAKCHAEPGRCIENPQGPEWGDNHVIRGGSWRGDARSCRASHRGGHPPHRYNNLGFRLVLSPLSVG